MFRLGIIIITIKPFLYRVISLWKKIILSVHVFPRSELLFHRIMLLKDCSAPSPLDKHVRSCGIKEILHTALS